MPKKSPLVSQHLEHIKFNALEDYQQSFALIFAAGKASMRCIGRALFTMLD